MESIKLDNMRKYAGIPVEIAIYDQEGSDQAPAVQKTIKKIQHCPDGTHIRFFFDDFYFLAVPLTSQVSESEDQWSAFDEESCLTYTIKKVQVY